ncbi:unnamed protein product [Pieris brassicae]|uniref:Lipocalin/cytosolic fatty-acid binding domain-containing protein n=1 Tax=Pieris brassicae TaxID=7116 RepID=A0A9P0XH99_PIEBR|nr:unnamed protein product [Pieris brassicae]
MYTFILISLFLVNTVKSEVNGKYCEGFKTDFDIKKAIGRWHVVAVIPDTNFSNKFDNVTCYRVDFSEVDEASLKWMITKRLGRPTEQLMDSEPGEVIRLRYHTEQPFDIWSKSVHDLKGCYRQLIDLKNNETELHLANTLDSPMLLHVLETGYGPFLLQMLWGRLAAVIYRREPGVTIEKLRPVTEFLSLYRGTAERAKLCGSTQFTTKRPEPIPVTIKSKILE